MRRYPLFLPFLAAWLFSACAPSRPMSAWSAADAAARLANQECLRKYGRRPFAPEDHEAVWDQGRWRWGGPDESHVDGFKATVSFGRRGEGKAVAVESLEDD